MSAKSSIAVANRWVGLGILGGIVLALGVLLNREQPIQQDSHGAPPIPTTPQAPTTVTRDVLSCDITMAKVAVSDPPLAVRLAANTDPATKVVAQLENGTFVTIGTEHRNWFLIQTPAEGWIPKSATEHACNRKVELMTFPKNGGVTTIHDRFVGSGQHLYRMNLQQGQTVTVQGEKGTLPFLLNVRHQPVHAAKPEEAQWSTSIPTTGHYMLEMDSNYKGYAYDFTLQVR
jgi:hypothetical protein